MVVGVVGRQVRGALKLGYRRVQIARLSQDQPQIFVHGRVLGFVVQRFLVRGDGGGMISGGQVGRGQFLVRERQIGLRADDSAQFFDGATIVARLM